ncbi:uncharacterized protein [Lepeophtheirus salmonis]|uniref:uncharacterized protein n=1 Tax=Lepeophtheirus salmonis TaxID=72036 RepID=UPI003AF3989F
MLKFNRRLEIIKPILDILLNETSTNPDASMLRRLLAFRKSLSVFQTNVEQVRYAVSSLLKVDEDMDALYLSRKVESGHHEEVELLLEAYDADLRELESQILSMKTMIEETNDFINTHLNTLRNKIMRMSLFMEIGTLSAGTGALVGGILGMNLSNGFEEHPTAFFLSVGWNRDTHVDHFLNVCNEVSITSNRYIRSKIISNTYKFICLCRRLGNIHETLRSHKV